MNRNKLILGTVQFGMDYGINNTKGKPILSEVIEILLSAHNGGLRYLDTAEAYGDAHRLIGDFHSRYPEKRFKLISKIPHELNGNINSKVNQYIEELNIDYLDVLLFHSFDAYKKNKNITESLYQLKQENKVQKIGVSLYTNAQLVDVISDPLIEVIQLPFNLLDNQIQRGNLLKKAKENGKIIHTRSAFLQGLFFKDINAGDKIVKMLAKELSQLQQIAQRYCVSIEQMALCYCLQQNFIDNVLIGVDNTDQLETNLQMADLKISELLIEEINNILVKDVNLLNPALWS